MKTRNLFYLQCYYYILFILIKCLHIKVVVYEYQYKVSGKAEVDPVWTLAGKVYIMKHTYKKIYFIWFREVYKTKKID